MHYRVNNCVTLTTQLVRNITLSFCCEIIFTSILCLCQRHLPLIVGRFLIYNSEGSVDILPYRKLQFDIIECDLLFFCKKNMEHSRTDFVRKIIAMYIHNYFGYSTLYLLSIFQIIALVQISCWLKQKHKLMTYYLHFPIKRLWKQNSFIEPPFWSILTIKKPNLIFTPQYYTPCRIQVHTTYLVYR